MFVAKNSDATSWHELLHYFGLFCTEFRKATKRSQIDRAGVPDLSVSGDEFDLV